ncbi:MAG: putative quinol monooxygenase, partial [Phycisphaeraceae bacterium]
MFKPDTCCTLVPYFTVQEGKLDAFKALGPAFIEKTKAEPAVLHYAFSFDGHTAHCREGYDDAAGILAHLENVGDLLAQALELSELSRLEI